MPQFFAQSQPYFSVHLKSENLNLTSETFPYARNRLQRLKLIEFYPTQTVPKVA